MSTLIEQFQSSFSAIILLDEIAIKSQLMVWLIMTEQF